MTDSRSIAAMATTLVARHRTFALRVLHSAEHDSQRERGRDLLAVNEILQGLVPMAEQFGEQVPLDLHCVAVRNVTGAVALEAKHSCLVTEPCLTFHCLILDPYWLAALYGQKCPHTPANWGQLMRRVASPNN